MTPGIEQQTIDVCGAQPGVVAVYLFGSVARGTDRPSSDVDVAVLFEKPPDVRLDGPRLTLEGGTRPSVIVRTWTVTRSSVCSRRSERDGQLRDRRGRGGNQGCGGCQHHRRHAAAIRARFALKDEA